MRNTEDVPTLSTNTERTFITRSFRNVSVPVVLILASGLLPIAGCNRGHNANVVATVGAWQLRQLVTPWCVPVTEYSA